MKKEQRRCLIVTALRRFEREARAAARIDHRHITRVYDYSAVGSGGPTSSWNLSLVVPGGRNSSAAG